MQQRYYDPLCGGFLSVDPVTAYHEGDTRFFNRYAYGFNNPYRFLDPDGRHPLALIIAGLTWLLTSGDAHAPAPGESTRSKSASEALNDFAAGVPAGKVGATLKMASDAARGSRRPTQPQREAALERSKDQTGQERCAYCSTPLDRKAGNPNSAEIDHKQAYSRGGQTENSNLEAACRSCNRQKGAKELETEWIPPRHREEGS